MRARLNNPLVLPWQFPQLERAVIHPQPVIQPEPAAADEIAPPEPETPEPIPPSEPPPPPAPSQPTETPAQLHAAAIERGLEEGRARGYHEGHAQGVSAGHAEGYAQGLADAKNTADAALAEQATHLATLIAQLSEPIPALEGIVEQAVAALALEVARAVIGGEVSRTREHMVRLIREALAKVPIGTGRPRLLLNPSDLELVRALAPDVEEQGTTLVPDEAIEPGGCVVVADTDGDEDADRRWHPRAGEGLSQIDLTLAARWRSVMHALFQGEDD